MLRSEDLFIYFPLFSAFFSFLYSNTFKQVTFKMQRDTRDNPTSRRGPRLLQAGVFFCTAMDSPEVLPPQAQSACGLPVSFCEIPSGEEGPAVHSGKVSSPSALFPEEEFRLVSAEPAKAPLFPGFWLPVAVPLLSILAFGSCGPPPAARPRHQHVWGARCADQHRVSLREAGPGSGPGWH